MDIAIFCVLLVVLGVLGLLAGHVSRTLEETRATRDFVRCAEERLERRLNTGMADMASVLASIAEELPKLPVAVLEKVETLVPPQEPAPRVEYPQYPMVKPLAPVQAPASAPLPPNPPANRIATLILMDEDRRRIDHTTTVDARRVPRGAIEFEGRKYTCCDKDPETNTWTYRHIRK